MSDIKLSFLGPATFSRRGQPVDLQSAKAVALLAYLAVTRTAHTREHVFDLLWPDSLPEAARKNLRNTLWALRKALGDDLLQTEADRLALAPAVWVDLHTFEAMLSGNNAPAPHTLQPTLDLYRTALLDGLALADTPDFEIWLATERERYGLLYLRGLELLAQAYRQRQQWPQMAGAARRALAHDNLQEPMYRVLMEAHARLGERAEALRQYDRLRATLAQELGVDPLPQTEALRAAILNGELPPVGPPAPVAPPPRPGSGAKPEPAAPFVGRQPELTALNHAVGQAVAGSAQVVLITGELGIGKTRLWQEWAAALPPDISLLSTHCLDTTQALPLAPLTGLFTRSTCTERLFTPPSPVPAVWLAELARLLPDIRRLWPDMPPPLPLPPDEERRRLFEAFAQTLRALNSRPLVLVIDDLHWADQATLDWLVYLVDRFRQEPLLLVGTYRATDASPQLAQVAANWSRLGLLHRLSPARLTPAESAQLIIALGGAANQAEALQARSAGNPYFLIELFKVGNGETPPGLAELIRTRLNRLPGAVQQVLQAAAVLEPGFDLPTLRRTSGRGEEETLDALDNLLAGHTLLERRGTYEFAHPLVAAVVRDDFSMARRSFLHRRAAEALEAAHAGHLEAVAGRLVRHYSRAGRPVQAARYADMAAERAMKLAAPVEAAGFYRQALQLDSTPARQLGLGHALGAQGNLEQARQAYGQALTAFEAAGNPVDVARAQLAMADSYLPAGHSNIIIDWAERALANLDPHARPDLNAHAHHLLGTGKLRLGRLLTEAEKHLQQAVRLAMQGNAPKIAARSQLDLGNLRAQQGDYPAAFAAFEQTIAIAAAAGDHMEALLGHNNMAYHAQLAGNLPAAHRHIEAGLKLADAHSLFFPRQYLYSTRGEVALAEGQPAEAETWFRQALTEAEQHQNQALAVNIRANLGAATRDLGKLDEALLLLETARRDAAALVLPYLQTQIDLWLAELYLERGEHAAAREALARALADLSGSERHAQLAAAKRLQTALTADH
jgi:DNA-binding SARP family transcriptional activator/predicted negative regulator of RcsB-dependent stress response